MFSVLYRLSSPFVKLDYIGRSCSWYRRYSEHKLEILSADQTNDSLPCYKYIRRNCHWTWFSIPFVASSDVIALEPQFIERFTPGLNSTFNRWSKYTPTRFSTVICRNPLKRPVLISARTRKGIDRATYCRIRDLCDHTAASNVQSCSPMYRKSIPMSDSLCCLLKATRSRHGLSTRASVDYGDQQMTDIAYLKQCCGLYLCQPRISSPDYYSGGHWKTSLALHVRARSSQSRSSALRLRSPLNHLHDTVVQNHRGKHLLRTAPISR